MRRKRELREEEVEGLLRGGGSNERRRKRELREEEEEGVLRGGGRGSFERRRRRDFHLTYIPLLKVPSSYSSS